MITRLRAGLRSFGLPLKSRERDFPPGRLTVPAEYVERSAICYTNAGRTRNEIREITAQWTNFAPLRAYAAKNVEIAGGLCLTEVYGVWYQYSSWSFWILWPIRNLGEHLGRGVRVNSGYELLRA
jgi:hypothetical protein